MLFIRLLWALIVLCRRSHSLNPLQPEHSDHSPWSMHRPERLKRCSIDPAASRVHTGIRHDADGGVNL